MFPDTYLATRNKDTNRLIHVPLVCLFVVYTMYIYTQKFTFQLIKLVPLEI